MKTAGVFILILFVSGLAETLSGQQKSTRNIVSGYVTNSDYFPVVGAMVMIDNKNSEVLTDEKGFYKVRIPGNVRSIGIYSFTHGLIEEAIDGRARINFRFSGTGNAILPSEDSAADIEKDEVNIGYNKVERRNLTTSVSSMDATDPRFATYSSVYEMMKGSLPGVQVNGDNVLIRGFTSMFGSNEPLYIVDGVPVSSLADISPQMVRSISVLKGPAAAIYGTRGANGVILVDLIEAPEIKNVTPVLPVMVPFVDTYPATKVSHESATLNALVNPNDRFAFVTFEYGTNSVYTESIPAVQSPVSGDSSLFVSALVSGLLPGTTYHYRVAASNSFGTEQGPDFVFVTAGNLPEAETDPATNTTPGSAELNGSVNPHSLPATIYFEFGKDSTYGSRIKLEEKLDGSARENVKIRVPGLNGGSEYHYRIVASNVMGTSYGKDKTFRAQYKTGDLMHGGYIFYIDDTGEHGLVCAPEVIERSEIWGNCVPEGAAGKLTGTGYRNTEEIILACHGSPSAAKICYDLDLNGFTDWFLPSVNELHLMFKNLHENGYGGFKETFYWSSTQDKYGAWVVSFFYGNKSNQPRIKEGVLIRPVRAF